MPSVRRGSRMSAPFSHGGGHEEVAVCFRPITAGGGPATSGIREGGGAPGAGPARSRRRTQSCTRSRPLAPRPSPYRPWPWPPPSAPPSVSRFVGPTDRGDFRSWILPLSGTAKSNNISIGVWNTSTCLSTSSAPRPRGRPPMPRSRRPAWAAPGRRGGACCACALACTGLATGWRRAGEWLGWSSFASTCVRTAGRR